MKSWTLIAPSFAWETSLVEQDTTSRTWLHLLVLFWTTGCSEELLCRLCNFKPLTNQDSMSRAEVYTEISPRFDWLEYTENTVCSFDFFWHLGLIILYARTTNETMCHSQLQSLLPHNHWKVGRTNIDVAPRNLLIIPTNWIVKHTTKCIWPCIDNFSGLWMLFFYNVHYTYPLCPEFWWQFKTKLVFTWYRCHIWSHVFCFPGWLHWHNDTVGLWPWQRLLKLSSAVPLYSHGHHQQDHHSGIQFQVHRSYILPLLYRDLHSLQQCIYLNLPLTFYLTEEKINLYCHMKLKISFALMLSYHPLF